MNLPNKLTVLRVIMVPFFVFFMLTDVGGAANKWIALVLFIVASLTDMLDGKIARKYNLVTNFGKFMDPLADKLLVCSAMICLVDLKLIPVWVVLIIIAREFIISGFRLVAAGKGNVIAAGIAGKIKTVTQLVAISIMLLDDPIEKWTGIPVGLILLYISAALSIWSCAEYIIKNKDALSQMK